MTRIAPHSPLRARPVALVMVATALLLAACSATGPGASTASQPASAAAGAASPASGSTAPIGSSVPIGATAASPTLSCATPAIATMAQTEGPYYKAGAPQASNLVQAGITGTRLTLTGYVVNTSCQPLANAKVEIWQADASGNYDNSGYRLRGWVLTDAQGRFTIETIIPGQYPGRTEHIHVKVTPAGGTTLTTQLYFPGQSSNSGDGIYDPSMLLTMAQNGDGWIGSYTFVLKA